MENRIHFCLVVLFACYLLGLTLTGSARPMTDVGEDFSKLSSAEEDYAYGTKTPCQRVKAFLTIADKKVEIAKKALKKDPSSDVCVLLKGYPSSLEGAWRGVAWGKEKRTDMTESIHSIEKTTQRHFTTLQKLEASVNPSQREALRQLLNLVLEIQKSEQLGLYAVKEIH